MSKKDNVAAVPKYRFPEFALDAPIDYVAGGFIFDPITNRNHHADLPILAITQEYGAIPRDEIDYKVSVTKKSLKAYKIVEKGDFIISLRSFQGGIEYSMYDGICSPAYIILRKKTDIIDRYYKYYFKSHRFIQDLNKDLEGIRDGKMISYSQFSSILLPKPDEEEQQKIADCLSSIDDLISVEEKKLSLLNDYKKGWMQKLFPAKGKTVPEWRFPEFQDNKEWETAKLINIADYRRGSFPQPYGLAKWYDEFNGMPFIQVFDVDDNMRLKATTKNKISKLASKQSVFIGKGTLIVTLQGSIGRVAITQYDAYIDRTLLLFEKFYMDIDKVFFAYIIQRLFEIKKQSAPGGMIKTITKQALSEFIVKLPERPEQEKIAKFLSGIDDLISTQTDRIEALKQHKKALMQGLFPVAEEVL